MSLKLYLDYGPLRHLDRVWAAPLNQQKLNLFNQILSASAPAISYSFSGIRSFIDNLMYFITHVNKYNFVNKLIEGINKLVGHFKKILV